MSHASKIPREFLSAVPFFVQSQGGGLIMSGGESSFGAGGYFQSPIDPLLPVSLELKKEVWRQPATIALVLDRSGSMGASVAGNLGNMTKMDLANEGAARTISLLGEKDSVVLYAVDTKPHEVIPLTEVGGNQKKLMAKARSVHSAGGGIFVYTGVSKAWKTIQSRQKSIKHIILFADAADAEEPGEYQKLVQEVSKANASISVIALGSPSDADAGFLQDLALGGAGRIFFVSNAIDVPAVFAQETVAVIRSTFVKERVQTKKMGGWRIVSEVEPSWPKTIDGFNMNYLKPKTSLILSAVDEQRSPLLAIWQKGLGKTAALAAPIGGQYSKSLFESADTGNMLHTLLEWLKGQRLPPGLGLRSRLEGGELFVDLFYNEEWAGVLATHPPVLLIGKNNETETKKIPWEKLRPGHFEARTRLPFADAIQGVVQIGEHAIRFGPLSVGRSPEWDFNPDRVRDLKRLSKRSGGKEAINLAEVWKADRGVQRIELKPFILIALLLFFLLEAFFSRIGKGLTINGFERLGFRPKSVPPNRIDEAGNGPKDSPDILPEDSTELEKQKRRRRMFESAKRKGV